jgi:hypothetical protein
MADWDVRRENGGDDNYWHRAQHDRGGAAVVYDGDRGEDREFRVIVNGAQSYVPYPDGTARYGDRGNPIGVLLYYDDNYGWTLYCYMFHGGDNPRVEWVLPL